MGVKPKDNDQAKDREKEGFYLTQVKENTGGISQSSVSLTTREVLWWGASMYVKGLAQWGIQHGIGTKAILKGQSPGQGHERQQGSISSILWLYWWVLECLHGA